MPFTARNVDDYAVVVGINEYPGYRPLKGAVEDAVDFAKWLCEEEYGGSIPVGNCNKVLSVKDPLAPLQDQIDGAFDSVFSAIPLGKPARRLYVYFSGHGMAESPMITDLCLASWAQKFPNRALDAQKYLDVLMAKGKFREIVMLLDCCRVRIVSAKGAAPGFSVVAPSPDSSHTRFFLANATEFLNSSYEAATADPGGSSDPVVRGYFTRVLMAALRGAAASPRGGVRAGSLKAYLDDNVAPLARADGWVQDSEVLNGLKGDPVFGSVPPRDDPPPSPPPQPPSGADPPIGFISLSGPRGAAKGIPLTLHDDLGAMHLTLFDSEHKAIFRGRVTPTQTLKLRPGPYTLRTQLDHATMHTPFSLQSPLVISTREQIPLAPQLYTAAPLDGAPTSHEYYTDPSVQWSHDPTRPPFPKADASLLIFVRAIDERAHRVPVDLVQGLTLNGPDGNQIADFSPSETERDDHYGWLAFHAAAPHGTYTLRFEDHTGSGRVLPPRELPLQLCSGWQTQLFLMNSGAVLLPTAKIFFARKDAGFQPQDAGTKAADVILNGLQSNQDLLTKSALNLMLSPNFDHPMLGLVGAHILLRRQRSLQLRLSMDNRKPNRLEAKQRDELRAQLRLVLRNLNRLLPSSPDVAALNMLAGSAKIRSQVQVNEPPMLRLGLLALMEEAASRPGVLRPESPIPALVPGIYADTPWSTWAPISTSGELNWVHFAVLDLMKKAARGDQKGAALGNPLEELAKQLKIPQQTVREAARDLTTIPALRLWKSLPAEYQDAFRSPRSKGGDRAAARNSSDFVTKAATVYENAAIAGEVEGGKQVASPRGESDTPPPAKARVASQGA